MIWAVDKIFKYVATDDALVKFSDEKTLPFIAFNFIVTDMGKMIRKKINGSRVNRTLNFISIFQYENLNLKICYF